MSVDLNPRNTDSYKLKMIVLISKQFDEHDS